MPAKKNTDMPLEKMLERLDEIAVKLDSDLPLDEALALYEEGVGLIKESNRLISEAEAKIKVLAPVAEETKDE
jgi:exodeoxyribonuclease VII small subunit